MFKFKLGSRVKCIISGFEGIATGNLTYINGCKQVLVRPPMDSDKPSKLIEGTWMDEQNLTFVDDGVVALYRHNNPITEAVGSDTPAPASPQHG